MKDDDKHIWHCWSSCGNPIIIEAAKEQISNVVAKCFPTVVLSWMPFFGQLQNTNVIIYILSTPTENTKIIEQQYLPVPVYFVNANNLNEYFFTQEIKTIFTKANVRKICRSISFASSTTSFYPHAAFADLIKVPKNEIIRLEWENYNLQGICRQLLDVQSMLLKNEKAYELHIMKLQNELKKTKAKCHNHQNVLTNKINALTMHNSEICAMLYYYHAHVSNNILMPNYL